MEKSLVVLSGAGISAESGIKTFRDADGLWEGHDVMEVASPMGWEQNKALVLQFYNDRRKQLLTCEPNQAHKDITALQEHFKVQVITQNVDDLHERAGNANVLHLHGELFKVRSEVDESLIYEWKDDLHANSTNKEGHSLRPHIVWFGEMVPELNNALPIVENADIILIIGTSLQVYPAASLIEYAKQDAIIYYIDPNPATIYNNQQIITVQDKATTGLRSIMTALIDLK